MIPSSDTSNRMVNEATPKNVRTVINISMLSLDKWNDFRVLGRMLVSFTRASRRSLCHAIITTWEHSYTENRGMYPYNLGGDDVTFQ